MVWGNMLISNLRAIDSVWVSCVKRGWVFGWAHSRATQCPWLPWGSLSQLILHHLPATCSFPGTQVFLAAPFHLHFGALWVFLYLFTLPHLLNLGSLGEDGWAAAMVPGRQLLLQYLYQYTSFILKYIYTFYNLSTDWTLNFQQVCTQGDLDQYKQRDLFFGFRKPVFPCCEMHKSKALSQSSSYKLSV